jgi:hypothetical protein
LSSSRSGTKLKNSDSLNVPAGPPSALAPLSEMATTIVLSSSPRPAMKSSTRPMWWSVWLRNPA